MTTTPDAPTKRPLSFDPERDAMLRADKPYSQVFLEEQRAAKLAFEETKARRMQRNDGVEVHHRPGEQDDQLGHLASSDLLIRGVSQLSLDVLANGAVVVDRLGPQDGQVGFDVVIRHNASPRVVAGTATVGERPASATPPADAGHPTQDPRIACAQRTEQQIRAIVRDELAAYDVHVKLTLAKSHPAAGDDQ